MRYLKQHPDKAGWFGDYGGAFLPPQLEQPFAEIAEAYARWEELSALEAGGSSANRIS